MTLESFCLSTGLGTAEAATPTTPTQLRGLESDKMEWIYLQELVHN